MVVSGVPGCKEGIISLLSGLTAIASCHHHHSVSIVFFQVVDAAAFPAYSASPPWHLSSSSLPSWCFCFVLAGGRECSVSIKSSLTIIASCYRHHHTISGVFSQLVETTMFPADLISLYRCHSTITLMAFVFFQVIDNAMFTSLPCFIPMVSCRHWDDCHYSVSGVFFQVWRFSVSSVFFHV